MKKYIIVKEASKRFNLTQRRIQKLCEQGRFENSKMIDGIWLLPENVEKPKDKRFHQTFENELTINELSEFLSISVATARNWVKLEKIKPSSVKNRVLYFAKDYVLHLKKELQTGENSALKSRRNKNFVSGHSLYKSYVSDSCKNLKQIENLLKELQEKNIELNKFTIQIILADCALKLLLNKSNQNYEANIVLEQFINGKINLGEKACFINDLISDKKVALELFNQNPTLFRNNYVFEENDDVLGLLYISCKSLANRKATGSYYTPNLIVKKLLSNLFINKEIDKKIFDPCCGTGNFLVQLPNNYKLENIFANDLDSISVNIVRINLFLKFMPKKLELLYQNVTCKDFLKDNFDIKVDCIIGNPPWGYKFSEDDKKFLKQKYNCAKNRTIESFDVVLEQSLNVLNKGGILSFVFPESILNVKTHNLIRNIIRKTTSIKYIEYLGNVFDNVQCPSIILKLEKTLKPISLIGLKVKNKEKSFVVNMERKVNDDNFCFLLDDKEYKILSKIYSLKDTKYLKNNAEFALGIVTGNNKKYISNEKTKDNEIILKGSDIEKFRIKPTTNYIVFTPQNFQQVAPTKFYRAKEKLFYKFISNKLVFAYDNKQILSLNSCNILIPNIKELNIKYILAVLNSSVAQFIYKKQFNSIKVLKSHIESIPIPFIKNAEQQQIINIVDKLINGENKQYDKLDLLISNLYCLTKEEQKYIKTALM